MKSNSLALSIAEIIACFREGDGPI